MIAVIPVRDGALPSGADEAIAECSGRALVVGSGTAHAQVSGIATEVMLVELGDVEPGRWSRSLAPLLSGGEIDATDIVVLPNSPDGRDRAPRL